MAVQERPSALDKATELLARRAHFERELAVKLAQRRYPPEEVAAALARLRELGYLDDERTSRELVDSRLRRGGEGKRRLAAELARRGAPSESIRETLAEITPDEELERARAAAQSFLARSGRREVLPRHLDRKGFSRRAIVTVLEEVELPTDGLPEDEDEIA
jgi:regulatory protein